LGYMLVYPYMYENICKKACTLELSKNSNKTRKKNKTHLIFFFCKNNNFQEFFQTKKP
jgi:hypothetical protein